MPQPLLLKTSPLSGLYRRYSVQTTLVAGWEMAQHFGNPALESQQLQTGSVLVDWSHLGKFSVSGQYAASTVEAFVSGAASMPPLASKGQGDALAPEGRSLIIALRLTVNDYLMLCQAEQTQKFRESLDCTAATVIDQSGALGCFAIAGPRRDEVWERSTAMNLRQDLIPPGTVIQTTVHAVRCTFLRNRNFDVVLHPRSLSESLFMALMDVGVAVGMVPGGIMTLPTAGLSS